MMATTADKRLDRAAVDKQMQCVRDAEAGLARALENLRQCDRVAYEEHVTACDLYQLTCSAIESVQALPEVSGALKDGMGPPIVAHEGLTPWAHELLEAQAAHYLDAMRAKPKTEIPLEYRMGNDVLRYRMVELVERVKMLDPLTRQQVYQAAAGLLTDHGSVTTWKTVRSAYSRVNTVLEGRAKWMSDNHLVRSLQRARVRLATAALWPTPGQKNGGLPIPNPATIRRVMGETIA